MSKKIAKINAKKLQSYLTFQEMKSITKTKVWLIRSSVSGSSLGQIQWYSPWRRYCCYNYGKTILDVNCLLEVAKFIQEQMELHKTAALEKKLLASK